MYNLDPEALHVISFETAVRGQEDDAAAIQMAPVPSAVGHCYDSHTQCDTC